MATKQTTLSNIKKLKQPKLLKLDLGAGKDHAPENFTPVDNVEHKGIKVVTDLTQVWPWRDNTVDEIYSRYLINYFTPEQRIHFMNEAYRVLKPGANMRIITPHWASNRAFADITQAWPPVAEEWMFHLSKKWRDDNAYWSSNAGYKCDFTFTVGYTLHPTLVSRNMEYQTHAVQFWKEAAQDMVATLTKVE